MFYLGIISMVMYVVGKSRNYTFNHVTAIQMVNTKFRKLISICQRKSVHVDAQTNANIHSLDPKPTIKYCYHLGLRLLLLLLQGIADITLFMLV